MTGALLATVRHEWGLPMIGSLLARAGETRSVAEIEDAAEWSSYAATLRLFHAAVDVTGDPDVPRRAGAEIFHRYASSEVVAMLRGLESPRATMHLIADLGAKQTTISDLECLEATDRSARISSRIHAGLVPDVALCAYRGALFASIPTIFGLRAAAVREEECQLRGGSRCLYALSWDPVPERDGAEEIIFLRDQVAALTSRFEALEVMASELASVGEIDDVLHTIITRASIAVRSPRYLLAVRLPGDDRPRVHTIGVDDTDVGPLAGEILEDPPDDRDGTRLIVDIRGATTRFGRLASLNPVGYRFVPEERRLLEAYAGHAAAALQTSAAWAETRRQVQTLEALLDLSTALAETRSKEGASERLASMLPKVLGTEEASVWVWYPDDAHLRCRGHSSRRTDYGADHGPSPLEESIPLTDEAGRRLTGSLRPLAFGDDAGSDLHRLGHLSGFDRGFAMPIVARGELFGVAVVASTGLDPQRVETLATRLPGVAGLAAGAFATAQLFEQIRYQARHDPLTGLPNLRALEESGDGRAGRGAGPKTTSGLLFVDLDRFKAVNDDFGHAVGDDLLVAVGQRLRQGVRNEDRVIRIGGDEFVVQLGQVGDEREAELVAARVLHALTTPFDVAGRRLEISASIGVALTADPAETIERLLSRSDSAMYRAKAAGGGTVRFAEP